MSNDAFLYFDDTNPSLQYSANQWDDNWDISGVYNNTLSSTTSKGATMTVEFIATEIAVIGATIVAPGASSDSGAISSYILDGSKNSAFVYQASAQNASDVVFFVSGTLSSGKHTLQISILSVSAEAPFFLDAIALQQPQDVATSTAAWVSTVFVTPSGTTDAAAASAASTLPVGAIVGGVVGGVAIIVGGILAFFFLYWRRRHPRYDYRGFSGEALFDPDEKDHFAARPEHVAQVEPFLAAAAPQPYSDTPSATPHASEFSASASASGAPLTHTYPPVAGSASGSGPGSASGSGSGRGPSSYRALSVVNDLGAGAAALTPAQRKAVEAGKDAPRPESVVQYHADSGVRFDSEGNKIEESGSGSGSGIHDEPPVVDVPPEYSEL